MTIDTYMDLAKAERALIEVDNLLTATGYRNEHGARAIVVTADLARRVHECAIAQAQGIARNDVVRPV